MTNRVAYLLTLFLGLLLKRIAQKPLIQPVTWWKMQVLELNSESDLMDHSLYVVKVVFVPPKLVLTIRTGLEPTLPKKVQKLCEFLARPSITFELEEIWWKDGKGQQIKAWEAFAIRLIHIWLHYERVPLRVCIIVSGRWQHLTGTDENVTLTGCLKSATNYEFVQYITDHHLEPPKKLFLPTAGVVKIAYSQSINDSQLSTRQFPPPRRPFTAIE